MRRLVCLAALAVAGCGTSAAEPSGVRATVKIGCSHVWVGPERGEWSRAENWSTGTVPDARSYACLPRGVTAVVSFGRYRVGTIVAGGGITIQRGTLLLMGTDLASEVADLKLSHGALGGPGKLIVTRRMHWGRDGAMLGVGDLEIGRAAHGVIDAGTGSGAARLGGDDGTGPHTVDAHDAPAPSCNRYSPPWAEKCATRHFADAAEIRRLVPQLDGVYVEGDRAVAWTKAPGSSFRFRRVDGSWQVR